MTTAGSEKISNNQSSGETWRCCQTNAKSSLFSKEQRDLGGQKLAPFEEGGVSVQLEANS